jgi:hypothetical protein
MGVGSGKRYCHPVTQQRDADDGWFRDSAGKARPFWNVVSVGCPFLGFFVGLVIVPRHDMSYGLTPLGPLLFGGGGGSILGLAAALAATVRNEPKGLVTVLGFLVNLPLPGLLLLLTFAR